ncbi:hypothetical protein ACOSQ3_025373 [Xanthoceras sorbifolium]
MAAACGSLDFLMVLTILLIISVALAEDQNQFIYNGFDEEKLKLGGIANVQPNGLLQLTNSSQQSKGYAFYEFPFNFNTSSSSQSLSFSTNFVFAMVPNSFNLGGNGMSFVISPSMDFSEAFAGPYLGLFNASNIGLSSNHILAVELDIIQNFGFNDVNGSHVGIDVNTVISYESATETYFSDEEGRNKSLDLTSGNRIQIWIDYNGAEKLLSVTLAPISIPKPSRPLLSTAIDLSQILLDTMYVGFTAATGTVASDHYVLAWSFNRSGKAEKVDISKLPSLPLAPSPPRKENQKAELMIIVLVVAVAGLLTTVVGAVCIVRKKKYEEVYEDWEREYGPHRFSYKTLYKATKGFKDKELIGKGGFGKVYGGVLASSNERIAVMRVSHDSKQGMKEFVTEIVSLGRLRHRNLVQLRGYCRRKGELLLVYDYVPNGSLDKILHSDMRPNLNWVQRFRILRGVASGLLYLHEEWEQVVLHRDIKPGNVLLDADLNGKLGDFGLARLYDHGSNPQTTKVVGTIGYMAPELLRIGKATTSTDVFAFGVFMLELACGRRPMEQDGWIVDCVKRGAILDASDPRLEGSYEQEQMKMILKLGLFCSHPDPAARPTMRQVMHYLEGDAKLPDIPPDSVIGVFTATSEYSDILKSFPSMSGYNSVLVTSTTDSIL